MRRPVEHILEHVLSLIDRPAFEAIRARYDFDDGPCGVNKYRHLETWIATNVQRAVALDLHRLPSRRILDIGTGCGYFPFVCRALGHEVVALDHPERPAIFRDVCALLGVEVIDHEVRPFEPLLPRDWTVPFDVITAYMVTFNGHMSRPWGVAEWRYFVANARSWQRPGGTIVLELNREPAPLNACYTPELEVYFRSIGTITGHWPHAPELGGHRVEIDRH